MACTLKFTLSDVSYEIPVDDNLTEKFRKGKTLNDILDLLTTSQKVDIFKSIITHTNMQPYVVEVEPTVALLKESTDATNIRVDKLITTLQDMSLPEGNHFKLRELALKLLSEDNNRISLVSKKITDGIRKGNGVYISDTNSVYIHAEPNDQIAELESLFAGKDSKILLERLTHELLHRKFDKLIDEPSENDYTTDSIVFEFNSHKKELAKDFKSIVSSITKLKTNKEKVKEILAYSFSNFEFLSAFNSEILNTAYENWFGNEVESFINVAEASSSLNSSETISEKVPFTGDTDEALEKNIAIVNPGTKEYQEERAVQVLARFNKNIKELLENSDFKYAKLDVSYGEPIEIDEFNGQIQILRLTENDLVRISKDVKWNQDKGIWEETKGEGKSSYRPVIRTYIDSNSEVMITLPNKSNPGKTYSIPAKFVSHFRKYEGDLIDQASNKAKIEEYSQWMEDNVNSGYGDDASKESIIRTFTLVGDNGKDDFTISVPSNYKSYGFQFSNFEAAKNIYEGLVVGDVVRVHWGSKPGKKAGGYRAKVLRKFGNSLEVVTYTGKVHVVKPNNLNEIIYLKENHEDFLDIVKKNDTPLGQRMLSQILLDDNKEQFRKYRKITFVDQIKTGTRWSEKINPYYDISDNVTNEVYKENQAKRRGEVNKLKAGDLVKIEWFELNKSSWYPVIAKTSDKIYFYNPSSGKTSSINIMESKEAEVYGIAFNNTESSKLFDEFSDLQEGFGSLWEGDVKGNLAESLKNAEATSIQDYYHITEIDDVEDIESGEDNDLKLATSQIQRGSILKAHTFDFTKEGEFTKTKVYKWFVVTGFDEATGRPIGITKTKDYGKQTGVYKEYPIEFHEIKAIGQRLADNYELSIYGNKVLSEYLNKLRNTYSTINEPIFINDSSESKKQYSRSNRTFRNALYGLRKDGKMGYAVSEKYITQEFEDKQDFLKKQKSKEIPAHLVWNYEGPKLYIMRSNQYMRKLHSNYLEVHGLLDYTPDIHHNVQIGDIVTEVYLKKDGNKGYIDGMITKVSPTGLWVEQVVNSPSNSNINIRTKKIYRRHTGVEYPNISSIYLHKKNDVTSSSNLTAKERQTILIDGKPEKTKMTLKEKLSKPIKKSLNIDSTFKTRDSESKIMEMINRLQTIYNVSMIPMRTEEINKKFGTILGDDVSRTRAFIYEGIVYINLDLASTAEPLHEMGHLILESIKKSNYDLYQSIIKSIRSHPYYDKIVEAYPNRTPDDTDEEVFITVFAEKYRNTAKSKYNQKWYDDNAGIFTNVLSFVKNMFSTIFQNDSILNLSNEEIISMNLDELISKFGDNLMEGKFNHVLNFSVSTVERKIVNLKSNLLLSKNESEVYLRKVCSI